MGVLYKAVHATQEMKRQAMIQTLMDMGVTCYKGRPVQELDYYEARHALMMTRIKRNF